MSYATILARQQEILQGLALLGTDNVRMGDWRVLDKGYDACAVLWAGGFQYGEGSYRPGLEFGDPDPDIKQEIEWITKVMYFSKFTTDVDSHAAFVSLRQAILDIIMGSPSLTSNTLSTLTNVKWARFDGTIQEAVRYFENEKGPVWIMEEIAWLTREWVTPTAGQYS